MQSFLPAGDVAWSRVKKMVRNLGFFCCLCGRMSETVLNNLTPHCTMKHFEPSPIADYIKLQTVSTIAVSIDNFSGGHGSSEQPLVSQDSGKNREKRILLCENS